MKKYFKSELQRGLGLLIGGLVLGKINFIFNPWTVVMHLGLFTAIRLLGYCISIYGAFIAVKELLKKIIDFIN